MKALCLFIAAALACAGAYGQAPVPADKLYLGETPPGLVPKPFAPGTVSSPTMHEFGVGFSSDGAEIYFSRRVTEDWSDCDIFFTRFSGGSWTKAQRVAFSTDFNVSEPFISPDNQTMYYSGPAPKGGYDEDNIWAVDRSGQSWSAPRYVGGGMYPTISKAGNVYITDMPQFTLNKVALKNKLFGATEPLRGGMEAVRRKYGQTAHPCIAPDESYLLFDVDGTHLFACFPKPDGSWGEAIDLTERGIPKIGGIPSISPDGKYLFYTSAGDIYWVSTDLVKKLKK